MKPLMIRLEPELPGIELEYRQQYLKRDIDQAITGMLLWVLPCLAFVYSDYLIFGVGQIFLELLAVRITYLFLSLLIVYILKNNIKTFTRFDWLVFLWSLITVLWNMIIGLAQPENFLSVIMISLVGVFTFYVFIPNPFYLRVIPPIIFSLYVPLAILFSGPEINLAFVEAIVFAFVITNLIGILFSARLYVYRRQEYMAKREEEKVRGELQRLASTDPLTGVFNRRRLLEVANETLYRFRRYARPFSILVMDLDGFKNLNDTLGHQQGDMVLIEFTQAICREKREADVLGRMGGDEFCLVMPETRSQSAAALAARIIKKCEEISPGNGALALNVTVSIGISEIRSIDPSLDTLLSRADAALYKAKNDGRNCLKIL